MQEQNFSEKVLEQIKEHKIQPTARWLLGLQDSIVWALVLASLVIGGLTTSVVLFLFEFNEWDLYDRVSHNFWAFLLLSLPYFWLIILVIFVIFIVYNFRHTKGGYKYGSLYVILGSVILSIGLGYIFYYLGLGNAIDQVLEDRAPLYGQLMNRKQIILHHPDGGVLPGKIIQVISPQQLLIMDIRNRQWQVLVSDSVKDCPCQQGQKIIAIGQPMPNNLFVAEMIRELRPDFVPPVRREPFLQIWFRP